jgi:hypothetical protein
MSICAWWSQLSSSEKAAWLQAIFSIVAIVVAIAVPAAQHRTERQAADAKDQRKARALGILLRAPLEQWLERFRHFEEAERGFDGDISPRAFVTAGANERGLFTPPPEVVSNLAELYLLGAASDHLFEAINQSYEAKSRATVLDEELAGDNFSSATEFMAVIHKSYASVQNEIRDALSEIAKIL